MYIDALFQPWYLSDGNYPPLSVGDTVNVAFEMTAERLEVLPTPGAPTLESLSPGHYSFRARVLGVYAYGDDTHILAMDTGVLRCYLMLRDSDLPGAGELIAGEGTLLLDHYPWSESFADRQATPDLFHVLKVTSLRWRPADDTATGTDEVVREHTIEQTDTAGVYVLGLTDEGTEGLEIQRTFRS